MSDLVWRLRKNETAKHLCGLGADEIERLRAALEAIAEVRHCEDDKAALAEIFRIVGTSLAKAREQP